MYKLTQAILGVCAAKKERIPVAIPANAIVEIIGGDLHSNHFVEVEGEGKRLYVFASDVRKKGEFVTRSGVFSSQTIAGE